MNSKRTLGMKYGIFQHINRVIDAVAKCTEENADVRYYFTNIISKIYRRILCM